MPRTARCLPCLSAPSLSCIHRARSTAFKSRKPSPAPSRVYEYVGDLGKPTAARLIPVSLFYGGHFEDAGTYLSRPVPLALQIRHRLRTANRRPPHRRPRSRLRPQLPPEHRRRHQHLRRRLVRLRQNPAPRAAKLVTAKAPGKSTGHAYEVTDDGKPHFGSKPDDARQLVATPTIPTPPTPTAPSASALPDDTRDPKAPDPDRPTLRRSATDTTGGPKQKREKPTSSVTATGKGPADDPDRPSFHRKNAGDADDNGIPPDPSELASKSTPKAAGGTVTGPQPMLDDSNRPGLHRGKPTAAPVVADLAPVEAPPKFNGRIPLSDLKQTVAVSDVHDIAQHDFSYHFASDAERATVLRGMQTLANEVLLHPALATDAPEFIRNAKPGADRVAAPDPSFQPSPRKGMDRADAGTTTDIAPKPLPRNATPAQRAAARRAAAAIRKSSATPTANALTEERLAAFQLSYGAPLTYVYTAHTADTSAPIHYVTVVAQPAPDDPSKLQIGLRSTTDSAHLDRTPRYRLVDAVDADASNRASLLFEVRSSTSRQFALFRLLGPKPDELFETGSTK